MEAVHRAAAWNYGHYTSMQVREQAVAGLSLHLSRLEQSAAVLFPEAGPLDVERVRGLVKHALGERRDASVRVTVLPGLDVMVAVSDPVTDQERPPLRVRSIVYEREMPHLKHVATFGLTFHAAQARREGFDDVVFTRRDGTLTEGSVWNAAFWDGSRVVWPEGPMLAGVTMQLLRLGLRRLGVADTSRRLTRESLAALTGAVATNSHCPAQPIASIDDQIFPENDTLTALLRRAWHSSEHGEPVHQ